MAAFEPAAVFPPGEIIRGELEARGWTQADLAEVMERPVQMVNEILRAKKRVTEETAKELEAALGIDAEFWLKTEALYRLRNAEPVPSTIAIRSAIRVRVPIRAMLGRGWITPTDDALALRERVCRSLGVASLEEHEPFTMAAKQTTYHEPLTNVQEVWLLRARRLAESMMVASYSAQKLEMAVDQFRDLLRHTDDARHVPKMLAEAGVRYLVVEKLPGLKIDGVCFWLSPSKPVIAVSLAEDRIDNFWFVTRHECEHVLNEDGKDGPIVDNDLDREPIEVSEQERLANTAAASFCVPQDKLQDFINRKGPLFTDEFIRQFAYSIDRHPGLVAGQLRRRLNKWNYFQRHLAKIRPVILSTALVDGFGVSPQLPIE